MENNVGDLSEAILELAKREGFESELKVASLLSAAGWKIDQNVYYTDKDELIGRELDVRAYKSYWATDEKPEVTLYVNLCIEVKRTKDPFVFFSSEPSDYEGGGGYSLHHWKQNVDRHVLRFEEIEKGRPLAKPKRYARSYSCMKGGPQHIKSGVLSAVKAAVHFSGECDERYTEDSRDMCIFLPILMVDGPIYECFFEAGAATLSVVERQGLIYKQNYLSEKYGRLSSQVAVFTLDGFADALPQYLEWGKSMLDYMKKNRLKLKKKQAAVDIP